MNVGSSGSIINMNAMDIERDNRHHIGHSGRPRSDGLTNPRETFLERFKKRAVALIGSDEDELTLRDELTPFSRISKAGILTSWRTTIA